jgi:hypothetical protein
MIGTMQEPWTLLSLVLLVDFDNLISLHQLICYHSILYMTDSRVHGFLYMVLEIFVLMPILG